MKSSSPSGAKQLSIADLGRMAQVLKLLAHPYRLKIVALLERVDATPVHDLVDRLGLPQAAVSGHLKKMRRLRLVQQQRRGQEVWYSLDDRRSLTILNCMRARKGSRP